MIVAAARSFHEESRGGGGVIVSTMDLIQVALLVALWSVTGKNEACSRPPRLYAPLHRNR